MKGVVIGSRWNPVPIERRDPISGAYECVNSPLRTRTEWDAQTALLTPPRFKFINKRIAEAQAARLATKDAA